MELMEMPLEPCYVCKQYAWYWPGDYYKGKKNWICGVCHPRPDSKSEVKENG